ncbi:ATP-dependent DNA helicase UvrD2 [Propionibacterium cyclohexanicum]|nr:ATP-dependent DNA helicase UvrD2 [Propionibacterium cyclohexanicum]
MSTDSRLTRSASAREADEEVLSGLDDQQREVAMEIGGPLVVVAGAGTGKTRAITHRIAHGVLSGQQQASAILAVTFTTRAAGEMRARLAGLGVPRVRASTFHAAALRQLRYFWPRVMGHELPQVTGSTYALVAEAASRLKVRTDTALLRDLVTELSWAKSTNVTPADYPAAAEHASRSVAGADPQTVARVAAEYERVKRGHAVMDYDDILLCAVALMHEHPEVAQEFRAGYRHFVVDEYQDVSPLQHSLLRLWLGERRDLCVVGDPDQVIHSFAGADARFLMRFSREFSQARTLRLERNYRSTPEVLQVANDLLHPPGRRAVGSGVVLRPTRPAGVPVITEAAGDEPAEAQSLAQWLAGQHRDGIEWSQMAVLFRVNSQALALEAALGEAHVPYVVRGTERFYARAETRAALARLRRDADRAPDAPASQAVATSLGSLGWTPQAPQGQGAVRTRWETWSALHDLATDLHDAGTPGFSDVVTLIEQRARNEQVPVADGVTLTTFHASKGLEWRVVALYGVVEGLMPISMATERFQIAEERRLLYVGITRARDQLRISWATKGSGNHARRSPSRFLSGLVSDSAAAPDSGDAPGPRRSARRRRAEQCSMCGRPLTTPGEIKLGHHDGCEVPYDEELFERLRTWRAAVAAKESIPAYMVFTDVTLRAFAEALPGDRESLLKIRGVGLRKAERFGDQVIALIKGASAQQALTEA